MGANEKYHFDRRGRELWPEMFVPAKKPIVHHTATPSPMWDALVRFGVERSARSGERRDYFRVKPGVWSELMQRELEALPVFRRMAERGLGLVGSGNPEARRGLEEMRDFHAYWEEELPAELERWEKRTGADRGAWR